jgi:MFS family permease
MLEHLNFSYITFMIVTASSTIFYLISLPLVGKFSDRFGNIKLLYISNLMFFLNPLMWIFIKSPILLILIPQLITGISNSTLIIASTDFAYDSVSPQKRGVCISYLNLLIGLGIFAGSLVGGALVKYSGISAVFPFFLVFGISAVCRLLSGILFLPKIKDERKFENLPPQPHHISILHPFRAVHAETTWLKAVFR